MNRFSNYFFKKINEKNSFWKGFAKARNVHRSVIVSRRSRCDGNHDNQTNEEIDDDFLFVFFRRQKRKMLLGDSNKLLKIIWFFCSFFVTRLYCFLNDVFSILQTMLAIQSLCTANSVNRIRWYWLWIVFHRSSSFVCLAGVYASLGRNDAADLVCLLLFIISY